MDIIDEKIDNILFMILYFICLNLCILVPEIPKGYGYDGEYIYFHIFIGTIPVFYLLKKGKIYVYAFSLMVMFVALFYYVTRIGAEFMLNNLGMCMLLWQIVVILLIIDIYLGFKILVREHIKYRKLSIEEKRNMNTLKKIIIRISYFFVPLFSYFFSLEYISDWRIANYWY